MNLIRLGKSGARLYIEPTEILTFVAMIESAPASPYVDSIKEHPAFYLMKKFHDKY